MVVYVDVVILENIIVNYFLIVVTAQTLSLKINNKRAILASVAAGLYTLVLFIDGLKFLTFMPVKILVAFFIIYSAFGKNKILFLLKSTLIYVIYTFVIAGLVVFLENKNMGNPAYGLVITDFSTRKLLLVLMILYIVIWRITTYVLSRQKLRKYTYDIEIITRDSSVRITALLDTGNELKEPLTNLPVIIVEKNALISINRSLYDKLYVPYKVVSGQSNYLEAFKPEKIKISYDKEKFEYKNAIIGISEIKLSEYNEYQGLLSRDII